MKRSHWPQDRGAMFTEDDTARAVLMEAGMLEEVMQKRALATHPMIGIIKAVDRHWVVGLTFQGYPQAQANGLSAFLVPRAMMTRQQVQDVLPRSITTHSSETSTTPLWEILE